jgi:hypothetical protein
VLIRSIPATRPAGLGDGTPVGLWGVYPNFPDPDLDNWARAYHGANLNSLLRIKERYDPDGFFGFHQSLSGYVPESAAPEAGSSVS